MHMGSLRICRGPDARARGGAGAASGVVAGVGEGHKDALVLLKMSE